MYNNIIVWLALSVYTVCSETKPNLPSSVILVCVLSKVQNSLLSSSNWWLLWSIYGSHLGTWILLTLFYFNLSYPSFTPDSPSQFLNICHKQLINATCSCIREQNCRPSHMATCSTPFAFFIHKKSKRYNTPRSFKSPSWREADKNTGLVWDDVRFQKIID